MKYNISAIRTFLAVAEEGGFRRAADRLGMAVATVSQHIAALEAELGVTLMERTTRRVTLTETGASYFGHCQRILRELEEVTEGASRSFREPTGLLRISVAGAFGRRVVTPVILKFMAQNPRIQIDLISTGQYVDLQGDAVDIAIRIGTPREVEPIRVREFAPVQRLLCASPMYLERCGIPEAPSELAQHQCIVSSHRPNDREWRLYTDKGEESAVPVNGRLSINDPELMLNACLTDLGIAFLPDIYVQPYLESGKLVRVLPKHRMAPGNLHASFRAESLVFPKVLRCLEFLETELAQVLR